jgi:hypothetical protein
MLRYPPVETSGVIRLRLHPATEDAVDTTLRWAIEKLEGFDLTGKLAVVDENKIRMRG